MLLKKSKHNFFYKFNIKVNFVSYVSEIIKLSDSNNQTKCLFTEGQTNEKQYFIVYKHSFDKQGSYK